MATWIQLRTNERIEPGPKATERIREDEAETPGLWTLATDVDTTWLTATFSAIYPAIVDDIYEFCYWMGFTPTGQQCMLLDVVASGYDRIACKSGQGPGKTTCSTLIGMWWCLRYRGATTMITAPSQNLARTVWIAEAHRRRDKAHPVLQKYITVTKSDVRFGSRGKSVSPEDDKNPHWRCITRTAAKAEGISGQHHDNLNLIIEEASGMDDDLIEALFGTVTNVQSAFTPDATPGCILMIGNPTRNTGAFFRAFNRDRRDWINITFNAEESPIVSRAKLARDARLFGRESNYYRVRALGLFPEEDARAIINRDDLELCLHTNVRRAVRAGAGDKQFGIDLARQGGDETVIYRRIGYAIVEWKYWPKNPSFEPVHALRWAFRRQKELGWANGQVVYCFDAGGIGQGIISHFIETDKDFFEFHHNGRPSKPKTYQNRISEAWFEFAHLVKEHKVLIPDDPILFEQLTDRYYDVDKKGLLVVEPKKDYMKRTGRASPDRADALVMAFYRTGIDDSRFFQKGRREERD